MRKAIFLISAALVLLIPINFFLFGYPSIASPDTVFIRSVQLTDQKIMVEADFFGSSMEFAGYKTEYQQDTLLLSILIRNGSPFGKAKPPVFSFPHHLEDIKEIKLAGTDPSQTRSIWSKNTNPWYQEGEAEYFEKEHQKIVERISAMTELNKKWFLTAQNDEERVKILFDDLYNNDRFAMLTLYSTPEQTAHFFKALESKQLLLDITDNNRVLKIKVIKDLKETAKNGHPHFGDQTKGLAFYLLDNLLEKQEKKSFKEEFPLISIPPDLITESYEQFYFRLL